MFQANALRFSLDDIMARKTGVQRGYLYKSGPSWLIRFREYSRAEDGSTVSTPRCERVGACVGKDRLTKNEAQREANRLYLDDANRKNLKPSSSMLVEDFIKTKFQLQVVDKKKAAGKKHYAYILDTFIHPALGKRRLCDITVDDVEILVAAVRHKGYSWQTAMHCQTCCSRIWKLAKKLKLYQDENPACGVDSGEKPLQKKRPGYTWEQAATLLSILPATPKAMAKLSVATSMNVAEMCGVRLKWCNFTDQIKLVEGEVLAPFSIGVRENWYEGERGTLKRGKRLRNVPLTKELAGELESYVRERKAFTGPEDPLFASRTGTPVDQHNISNRTFKTLTTKLGFPVNWHAFRRAHSTFVGTLDGISVEDRRATMGHADAEMTLYYSVEDTERRRAIPQRILERLANEPVKKLEEMKPVGPPQ